MGEALLGHNDELLEVSLEHVDVGGGQLINHMLKEQRVLDGLVVEVVSQQVVAAILVTLVRGQDDLEESLGADGCEFLCVIIIIIIHLRWFQPRNDS